MSVKHVVKSGETLWEIAQRYNITVARIKQLNKLKSDIIHPGDQLVIKPAVVEPILKPPVMEQEAKPLPPRPKQEIAKGKFTLPSMDNGFKLPPGKYSQEWIDDLCLLARIVYAEAGAEPYEGQVAVAAVVLNRLASSDFPNTIYGIIYQPLQFEPVDNGAIDKIPSNKAYMAATEALSGKDPTDGALYFWNPYKVSKTNWVWKREISKQIGNHVFAK